MSKFEALPLPHTEQARVNRKEHLYHPLLRVGAIGAIALSAFAGMKMYETVNTQTPVGETIVTVHTGETAIDAVNEGIDIIATENGVDQNSISGGVEQGQIIGSHIPNGLQIKVDVMKNGLDQMSAHAERIDPTNIPRQ